MRQETISTQVAVRSAECTVPQSPAASSRGTESRDESDPSLRCHAAVAAGDLTAAEAAELAKVVDVYVRALNSKGFDERLSALEKGINGTPDVPGPAAVRNDTRV